MERKLVVLHKTLSGGAQARKMEHTAKSRKMEHGTRPAQLGHTAATQIQHTIFLSDLKSFLELVTKATQAHNHKPWKS